MNRIWSFLLATVVLSQINLGPPAHAATVVKINLGSDATEDVQLVGGVFSTVNQGNAATTGHQDTNAVFLSFLDPYHADIDLPLGSFSLTNVATNGPVTVVSGIIAVQPTLGGDMELYDDNNVLLLKGTLSDGAISGPIGGAATGSFLTAALGQFTGGTLAHLVDPNSLSVTIAMTAIKSAGGLTGLQLNGSALRDFSADATGGIAALVPEPTSGMLAGLGTLALLRRRRRRNLN